MKLLRVSSKGFAIWDGRSFRCAIGKNGVTANKHEGDFASPIGCFPIRQIFFREDRIVQPFSVFPTRALTPQDGWCDDVNLPEYNKLVRLPFQGSHEILWRDDHVYDIIVVLGYNDVLPISGAGSAIFLHIAREEYAGTAGCVAMSEGDLRAFLSSATLHTRVCIEK